ncbi:MAG: hypothetical protein ABEJ65_03200 [bacterium]
MPEGLERSIRSIRQKDSVSNSDRELLCRLHFEADKPFWNYYPSIDYSTSWNPSPSNELILYTGFVETFLNILTGLPDSSDSVHRTVLVPSRMSEYGSVVSDVNDTMEIPSGELTRNPTPGWIIDWITENFENRFFDRILNLSPEPSGAWLGTLLSKEVEFEHFEGMSMVGLQPVIKGGPQLDLFFEPELNHEHTNGSFEPFRGGYQEGFMMGRKHPRRSPGINTSRETQGAVDDFLRGLSTQSGDLIVLAPRLNPDDVLLSVDTWISFAKYWSDYEDLTPVFFGSTERSEFHYKIRHELVRTIPFVEQWFPRPAKKLELLKRAEYYVATSHEIPIAARLVDIPGIMITDKEADCVLSPSSGVVVLNDDWEERLTLSGDRLSSLQSVLLDPKTTELPQFWSEREYIRAILRESREKHPQFHNAFERFSRIQITDRNVQSVLDHLMSIEHWFVVENLLGMRNSSPKTGNMVEQFSQFFGAPRESTIIENQLTNYRESLVSLQRTLVDKIASASPSPGRELNRIEQRLFDRMNCLWRLRVYRNHSALEHDYKWGFRNFFERARGVIDRLRKKWSKRSR